VLIALINVRRYYCMPFSSAPLLMRAFIIGALFNARPFDHHPFELTLFIGALIIGYQ